MSPYEDMVSMPYHRSSKRAHMTRQDRAAQFAPFAALSGYETQIAEAGRLTDTAAELMEGWAERINKGLQRVQQRKQAMITATYFIPDERKSGGAYKTVTGQVRKFQEQERRLILENGTVIPFDRIYELLVE